MLKGLGSFIGIEYSDGKQGEIKVTPLPSPQSASKVSGIGKAMETGQDILIFRQTRKSSSLELNRRNFFFITRLMESYSPEVKVIELGTTVSYPNGDYFMTILDYLPTNGYGVIKKEADGFKMYSSTFAYSENYDEIVTPVKVSIEQVLGPSRFDKEKMISQTSKYKGFVEAKKSGNNIILYCFADACGNLPPSEQSKIERELKAQFTDKATIIKINPKLYTDPANELYSRCENIVSVYNGKTKEIYPALFTGKDVMKNVRTFLARQQ